MKLNERHLMQLAAVLDAGGVSEGAAMLGLTQPAVSRSLAMLEARVGEPLFVKGRRPLQATPLGAQLGAQGRAIIAASRKASDVVQGFVRGTKGLVRVGGVPFFMDAMISRMIGEFQTLYSAPAPTHLKLDVDGIEGVILRGAVKTLPSVKTVIVEVEGENLKHVEERIEHPLFSAGFYEDASVRGAGSNRNRLYLRR